MTVTYPLRLFFDCSTVHLSQSSRDYLRERSASGEEMIAGTPYGWFVWAGEETDELAPPDLAGVLDHARSLGAEYVLFDADAVVSEDLPTFAWSG